MNKKIKALIDHFHFSPLPSEGTFFVSTWRSRQEFPDGSPTGTAMIGMFCNDPLSRSVFHRLPVDEVWHFYSGDPIRLVLLEPNGASLEVILGGDPLNGQAIQYTVPAGTWQAGCLMEDKAGYALFGCTMAPGFTGNMYEGATRSKLLAAYPERRKDILFLTDPASETHMPDGFAR
jgi:predicted cupin superfamily sugar epimerase